MNKLPVILAFEEKYKKERVDPFEVGDTVNVHTIIKEGEKSRTQIFSGVVIAISKAGLSSTFTVRRVSYSEGMERVFQQHSPGIAKIEVLRSSIVHRAKLTFLRQRTGKKAKLPQKITSKSPKNSQRI